MDDLNDNVYLSDYYNYLRNDKEQLKEFAFDRDKANEFEEIWGDMVIDEKFNQSVTENPFYNHSHLPDIFLEPFMNYEQQFSSIYRFWLLNKELLKIHFDSINLNSKSAEEDDLIEGIKFDNFFFIEQFQNFIITMNISLLENFFVNLTNEAAKELNIANLDSFSRHPPMPDKYINWLKDECKFEGLNQNKLNNKKWDAIRTVRNRFIHAIDRSIPKDVQATLDKISQNSISNSKNQINSDPVFVEFVFFEMASLVKKMQEAFLNRFYR